MKKLNNSNIGVIYLVNFLFLILSALSIVYKRTEIFVIWEVVIGVACLVVFTGYLILSDG